MTELNQQVFHWINRWPEAWSPFLRLFSEGVNQLWFKIGILVLTIAMCLAGKYPRATAIMALIGFGITNFCTDLWKYLMSEPRPFNEIHDYILRAGTTPHAGTASAHAGNMAAVATVFVVRQKWWGAPWFLAAILTGFSRVYVGVHYPYQVLLGWGTGVFCSGLVLWIHDRFIVRKGRVSSGVDGASIQTHES